MLGPIALTRNGPRAWCPTAVGVSVETGRPQSKRLQVDPVRFVVGVIFLDGPVVECPREWRGTDDSDPKPISAAISGHVEGDGFRDQLASRDGDRGRVADRERVLQASVEIRAFE